ncbi:MAG: hypothetical protein QGG40_09820, partial [Myxococcota bacterium]|nr:hypothetical protein [Myxococcota bacterium]
VLKDAGLNEVEVTFEALQITPLIHTRRRLCHLLLRFKGSELEWFTRRLAHRNPRVVKDILYCLLEHGSADAYPHFLRIYRHPRAEIRKAALSLLRHHSGPVVAQVLLLSLDDPAETNRLAGLKQIARAGNPIATAPLTELVQDSEFARRSIEEKRAVVQALVATAGPDAVPVLRGQLRQKFSLVGRKGRREAQLVATEGLASMDNALTRHILRSHRHDLSNECRAVVDELLDRASSDEQEVVDV